MAKIVKATLNAVIAVVKTEITGWALTADNENKMVYNLKDANGTVKGSIDMSTLGGGNLNGTVVSDIEYSDITSIFN